MRALSGLALFAGWMLLGACAGPDPTPATPPTATPPAVTEPAASRGEPADVLVVLNKAEATASLVNPDTRAVVATIGVGEGPHEVAVSPDASLAVVANYGTRGKPGTTLSVIDLQSRGVRRTIELAHERPHGIQFRPGGNEVVVTVEESRALICVDVVSGELTCEVPTGQDVSHMVALSPDGARAYVANIGSGSLSVIDTRAGKLVKNVPTGDGAEGIDVTPDGSEIWVTNRGADTISVVNASSLEIEATLESKSFPIRAKITPDGRFALVSNARSGVVRVFDVKARAEARVVPLDAGEGKTDGRLFGDQFGSSSVPIGIVITPDGKRAFVAHANADVISVIDLTDWKVVGTLEAGKEPDGMAFAPAR